MNGIVDIYQDYLWWSLARSLHGYRSLPWSLELQAASKMSITCPGLVLCALQFTSWGLSLGSDPFGESCETHPGRSPCLRQPSWRRQDVHPHVLWQFSPCRIPEGSYWAISHQKSAIKITLWVSRAVAGKQQLISRMIFKKKLVPNSRTW